MSSPELHTDGNAIAGLLQEIFAREMTAAIRSCQSCGARNPVGAHRLYEGAGLVLRCATCGDLAACIATRRDGYAVTLHGTWLVGEAP
jgi:Family of unknown function (DUF6510)